MGIGATWHRSPLGRRLFGIASAIQLASAQTFKYPEGATPTQFQGFVTNFPGLVTTWSCVPGSTHTTHSTLAACCVANQNCEFFTACNAGTATRIDGSTYVCSGTLPNCYTMTIYQSYPSAAESWSAMGCVQPGFDASTVYREIVVPIGTSSGLSSGPSRTVGSSSSSTPAGTGNRDSVGASQADSAASRAWIAGAVVGPVVAIALAAFLAYRFGRRKGRGEAGSGTPTTGNGVDQETAEIQDARSPSMVKSELAGAGTVVELPDHRVTELDSHTVSHDAAGDENGREVKH